MAAGDVVCDALFRPGEQSEKGRAIRARKIETIIKLRRRERDPSRRIGYLSARDQAAIDPRNRRQQFARAVPHHQGYSCRREVLSHRRDRRHGQDQVADPFKLDEQDVQPAFSAPSPSLSRKRRAAGRGNGPR